MAIVQQSQVFEKFQLSNGLTVVAERHPQVRSVSLGLWVNVGSRYETASLNGMSHFIEHMVFKGTKKRNALGIATQLESLGGDVNAFTDRETTCFHAYCLSEHLEVALDVLSDITINPSFPKDEMDRERKVLIQELSMIEDSPDDYIADHFLKLIWKNHPLGRTVIGSRGTISGFSRAKVLKFFSEHYHANNMILSVAGNIEFSKLRDLAQKYFGGLPSKKHPNLMEKKKGKPPVFQKGKKQLKVDSDQLHLFLGFDGIGFQDDRRFDALILSFFLGGGMSSRLFQEVREKQGLAYSIDCDCVPFSDVGIVSFTVSLQPKSLSKTMQIIGREMKRLRETPLSQKEIETVKGQIKGTILLSSDQMETRQESLGRNEMIYHRYISVEEVVGELEKVSPESVQRLAKKVFVPEKQASVILSRKPIGKLPDLWG